MAQGETTVGAEPNSEAINFRVPKSMKINVKLLCEYGQYSGPGELLRALVRKHQEEVVNSQGYKFWLKRKEQETAAKKEAAKQGRLPGTMTDGQLQMELADLLHPGVGDREVMRGCEIIETLMKREKSRRVPA